MNPSLISTPHPNLCTHSSKLDDQALSAQDSPQNHTSRDMESAPTLQKESQSLEGREVKQKNREIQEISPDKLVNILQKLIGEPQRLSKEELKTLIEAFFCKHSESEECRIANIYNQKSDEIIEIFEAAIPNFLYNMASCSDCNALPVIPEDKVLALEAILNVFCLHLESIQDVQTCSPKTFVYLNVYIALSAYYEAPASDQDFPEYSRKRITAIGKLLNFLGPFKDAASACKTFAQVHKELINLQARLLNQYQQDEERLLKIKQDYACLLMGSFQLSDRRNLIILDCLNNMGIDFHDTFINNPQFIALLLKTQSDFFKNTESFYSADKPPASYEKPTARVYLLKKLESLGLKLENIHKHHPILELALELKDPELLRHLILEYKFNPYYISDTTGYSVWQFLTKPNTHYSEEFRREAASILKRFEIKYYTVKDDYHQLNAEVENIAINKKTPHPFNINNQNQWGETPLIRAAKFGFDAKHLFAFEELDLARKDENGKTALDYAKENNHKALVKHIEEHKRALTTLKLIDTLGVKGRQDNYQGLIAFLHKKSTDGLSLIEKAYHSQNTLVIEAIEAHLPAISLYFGEYARRQAGQQVQLLDIKTVLKYLKGCFCEKHPEALTKLRLYTYYYYCMHVYVGLSDAVLNEAIHGLIALIPDMREVDVFSQDILGGLINLYNKTAIDVEKYKDKEKLRTLAVAIGRKAYKNVAHWLLSPVCIKHKSKSSFIISFLNNRFINVIHQQEEVRATKINLRNEFFNDITFLTDILSLCKQNLSGYRANTITIIQKLKELGLDLNIKNDTGYTLLHLAIEFEEIDLLKYLILEEGLNPFGFNQKQNNSWSCASYCRHPETFSSEMSDPQIKKAFHKLWQEDIEPVLMKQYLDLPEHSLEAPRVDLIAQGKIEATPENINLQNQWGETPLIFAAKYGYNVAKLLTIAGIDVELKDKYKKTALSYATENRDQRSKLAISNQDKKHKQLSQLFSAVNTMYQNKKMNETQKTTKKLSKRQLAQLKADQARQKKEEEAKAAAQSTQKATPPPITITIPELIEQPTDNFLYQEPAQEASHLQQAKDKISKADKKQDAKKQKKSLLGRVISGAKELKATLTTATHIAKNPSQASKTILQSAAQRLATSKEVSTRVEAQNKPLLIYPDLLELLDLVQAQDSEFHVASNIQKILEAIDIALNAHSKNPNIGFSLQQIETVLQWFYPDMTVSQHGSHRTYHFSGMPAITIATHKDNEIFKKALQSVQNRIREALLKKLGIKSYDVSETALSASPTDSPPTESKDESSEEEKSEEFSS